MLLRWLIRAISLVPLALSISVWVWSYYWVAYAIHYSSHYSENEFGIFRAQVYVVNYSTAFITTSGWQTGTRQIDRDEPVPQQQHRFLGFHWYFPRPYSAGYLGIPLWFPTVLLALFVIFVWRKTRPSATIRAFPIETSTPP